MATTSNPVRDRARLRRMLEEGTAQQLRGRVGMPREELARQLGVDYTSVYRWETGPAMPRSNAVAAHWLALLDDIADELPDDQEEELATASA